MKQYKNITCKIAKLLTVLLLNVLLLPNLFCEPTWWKIRGVVPANSDQSSPETIRKNYAPANLGQLKFFAEQAANELNEKIEGGAGNAINSMIASFSLPTSENPNVNYKVVNIGQIKSVLELFYDRLSEVSAQIEFAPNMVFYGKYPWRPMSSQPTEADYKKNYAIANIGQLKFLFDWEVKESTDSEIILEVFTPLED